MLRNVFLKSLWDTRRSMRWWLGGVALYAIAIAALFPMFEDALGEMLKSYPPEIGKMLGFEDMSSIATAVGFLNAEIFSIVMPILFVIFAVAYGAGAIAGEEESGTMETLLSEPVTREKVVVQKFGAMAVTVFVLGFVLWVALVACDVLFGMDISVLNLAAVCVSISLLGIAFGGIAFAAGAITGRRGISIGIPAAVAAIAYIVNALSGILEALEPLKWISPFFYYNGGNPIMNGLDWVHALVLVGISLIACGVAYYSWPRRDLRVQ